MSPDTTNRAVIFFSATFMRASLVLRRYSTYIPHSATQTALPTDAPMTNAGKSLSPVPARAVGSVVGIVDGAAVDGRAVGTRFGLVEGHGVVGTALGCTLGRALLGLVVGRAEGDTDGGSEGGTEGATEGSTEGFSVTTASVVGFDVVVGP